MAPTTFTPLQLTVVVETAHHHLSSHPGHHANRPVTLGTKDLEVAAVSSAKSPTRSLALFAPQESSKPKVMSCPQVVKLAAQDVMHRHHPNHVPTALLGNFKS